MPVRCRDCVLQTRVSLINRPAPVSMSLPNKSTAARIRASDSSLEQRIQPMQEGPAGRKRFFRILAAPLLILAGTSIAFAQENPPEQSSPSLPPPIESRQSTPRPLTTKRPRTTPRAAPKDGADDPGPQQPEPGTRREVQAYLERARGGQEERPGSEGGSIEVVHGPVAAGIRTPRG